MDYLLHSHDPTESRRALRQACRQTRWLGLSILEVDGGCVDALEGTVCFEARHREGVLVETSLFQRRGGDPAGSGSTSGRSNWTPNRHEIVIISYLIEHGTVPLQRRQAMG